MWDQILIDFGIAGVFILYLIYDRQILLKGIKLALDKIGEKLHDLR